MDGKACAKVLDSVEPKTEVSLLASYASLGCPVDPKSHQLYVFIVSSLNHYILCKFYMFCPNFVCIYVFVSQTRDPEARG